MSAASIGSEESWPDATAGRLGEALPVASTDGLDRAAWLEHRRAGIGGSDVSAILGLNPYRSALAVWLDKTGAYTPDDVGSEAMAWGTLLEPVVADEFSRRAGVTTAEHRWLLRHPERPYMLANVDRVVVREPAGARLGVYEGKTTSPWSAKDWADNRIPDSAMLQTQHYLAVTGLRFGWVAVLIGGQRLEWRRVEADDDLARLIVGAESEFWKRVEQLDPPAPVATDARFLGDVWRPEPDKVLTLGADLLDLLVEREAAKADEKAAKTRADEAEAALKLALGDHEYGADETGRLVCSWRMTQPVEVAAHTRAASRRFIPLRKKARA